MDIEGIGSFDKDEDGNIDYIKEEFHNIPFSFLITAGVPLAGRCWLSPVEAGRH